jgi:hypothetical protein
MWKEVKKKVFDWGSTAIAFAFLVLTGSLIFIVPITLICGCAKLIMLMFGV